MRTRRFFVAFALVALVLAGAVSYFASSAPDGLNRVAEDHGMARQQEGSAVSDGPLAGYGVSGVGSGVLSGGLAGVVGVVVVLGLTRGIAYAVRRRSSGSRGRDAAADGAPSRGR